MLLKVLTPNDMILKKNVTKIIAEDVQGNFELLPKHIDFLTKIVPCILLFSNDETQEGYIALDEGILVKHADRVNISVKEAYERGTLGELRETMEKKFKERAEEEQKIKTEITKLELAVVKSFYDLKKLEK